MGNARVLRNPLSFLAFSKVFRTDIARLHNSIAVGQGHGFASNVHLISALLRSRDAGFEARGKRVGSNLLIHHDIGRVLTLFIVRPTDLSNALLDPIGVLGTLGPERSQCWDSGSNNRNILF